MGCSRWAIVAIGVLLSLGGAGARRPTYADAAPSPPAAPAPRPRARDVGLVVGILPPGTLNAITDVPGVMVGHTTVIRGDHIRTGVTAVLPHAGNIFRQRVAAAIHVGNGFGKLVGSTQVAELGELETPILLTSTLNVPRVADALIDHMLATPGNEDVQSVNPLVAETNDGQLNDVRARAVGRTDVLAALRAAKTGPVDEGSVGAGTGTVAFGWKGGIGTSSRRLPERWGGHTVGVLVQTNYGGILSIAGAPVGRELGRYFLKEDVADGSVIVVVATDAPLDARNLRRLAARTMLGLGRTGAAGSNGSGDYAIAFSTARGLVTHAAAATTAPIANEATSPLFLAAVEATEEAVYNSLFRATTVTGRGRTVEALPLHRTLEILRRYGALAPRK